MEDTLKAGTILIEDGTVIPECFRLETEPDSNGWKSVANPEPRELDRKLNEAGWIFFYMASEIKSTVFGLDRQKAMRSALKRVISQVKAQNCNGLQITLVTTGSFLKLPCVSISAHSRHIQQGPVLSGMTRG
jgi:hypothetical protein